MRNKPRATFWGVGARPLWLSLCTVLLTAGPASAQINSNQMHHNYEKGSKGGGGGGANIDDAVKLLNSSDANKRLAAVKSLGTSKDEKAIPYLIASVGDTDVRVQAKAVQMLGDIRATDATPVLVQYLFLRAVRPEMKRLILASLGKIGDSRAVKPLTEYLERDLDPATRGTVIFALGEIGAPEAVEPLQNISRVDQNATVRRLASEAVNKVQQHQALLKSQVKGPAETFLKPDENAPPKRH